MEAHGEGRDGGEVERNGGSLAAPVGGSHGISHHCPMAPSVFLRVRGGSGSPLAGQGGPSLAVGPLGLSGVAGARGCPALCPHPPSPDELSPKRIHLEGVAWHGVMPLWVQGRGYC